MTSSTPGVPPLARGLLDRAAHRRTDAEWQRDAWAKARVLVVHKGRALVSDGALVLLDASQAPDGERFFLGVDADDTPYFAVTAELLPEVAGAVPQDLRQAGDLLEARDAGLLITAVALASWHHRHAFSARSGSATLAGEAGWTRVTDDGETSWPRTDPAVIVLVHDGVDGPEGRCLLGHNATWTTPGWENRYSCLAGFVEPGESAEATVIREVGEEVGVEVTDLRYIASQPWPFPGSLMLGFFARADPDAALHPDPAEISHARWFTRAEIGAALAGQTEEFGLPSAVSIAHYLITRWHSGQP